MQFTLMSRPGLVFTATELFEHAGIRCVRGEATMRQADQDRSVNVETVARMDDVNLVADTTVIEVTE